jgi:predicted dehydrogenase
MHKKVSVIGCGAVVQQLYRTPLQQLERHGLIDLVGLVDIDSTRAMKFQRYFKKAIVYNDLQKSIVESQSELIIVASPARYHKEHTILGLQNHCNVLCEKPMSITKIQCEEMNDAAKRTGMKLSIGMIRRYYPALRKAKNIIKSGLLGEVTSFYYSEGLLYNWPVETKDGFLIKDGGGGVLLDMGAHVFDILFWLFGKPKILSHYDDCLKNGIEASTVTKLDFNGISGIVHLSWEYDLPNTLCINFTNGKIIIYLDSIDKIQVKENNNVNIAITDVTYPFFNDENRKNAMVPRNVHDCIYMNILQMLWSIDNNEMPENNGVDAATVISTIEECYQIAQPIDMNWLPADENISFKNLHWRQYSWNQ